MHVTDEWRHKFLKFPPFFATVPIPVTRKDPETGKEKTTEERKLCSYMECSDLLIATTLFKWYMEQEGIVCDNISKVIKYNRYQPYKAFVELGCNMRRDKSNKMAAEVWKLMLNAAFGKMAQNNAAYASNKIVYDKRKLNKCSINQDLNQQNRQQSMT